MKETLKATLWILLYGIVAAIIVYFGSMSGTYPDGSDTMFYVYREDCTYHSILDEGVVYPLWNKNWYNGVQISRYWSPFCTYVMTFCEFVCGGNPYNGYLVFSGLLYLVGAIVWLRLGYTHGRPYLGAVIGLLWGILPHNLFQIYCEGVLVRCMILTWLPAYIVAVWDYLHQDRKNSLFKSIIYMFLMVMTHMGYAGMVALAILLYIVIERIVNRVPLKKVFTCIGGVLLAMAIAGIWLVPSLVGGITGIDSSQVMANHFAPLIDVINPFKGILIGQYRWISGLEMSYFGIVLFVLCILGICFSRKKAKPGFIAAFITVLLTSKTAYPFLARLPGGSMLWMLRFMSIAICLALIGFLFWDTLRRWVVILVCVLLLIEAIPSWEVVYQKHNGEKAEDRYERILDETLLRQARDVTIQRATVGESYGLIDEAAIYILAGYEYGVNNVPIEVGQGVQAAVTYKNIVQQNQALDDKHYLYFFDRCLEMGDDTVIMDKGPIKEDEEAREQLIEAGRRLGYKLYGESDLGLVFHKDVDGNFGIITKYNAIGIGKSNTNVALAFPSVEEAEDPNINHYTVDELAKYKTVFLSGFIYDKKEAAEELIKELSDRGTRVIIFADTIPIDTMTSSQQFLGVTCQQITFNNGYPELDVLDGRFDVDLFPREYAQWKTIYLNGLDDVKGTITDSGQTVAFLGNKYNDNILFVGINLFFHYQLTRDETIGQILSEFFKVDPDELPDRRIVPLEVEASGKGIRIVSPEDDVNTTFAFHDIFVSEQPMREKNNLLHVDKGETIIKFKYPLFVPALLTSIAGIILTIILLIFDEKRRKKEILQVIQTEA
ncbi:MAG: hypothetical protein K6E39_04190 [Lachnospiraceae bacterium]|nr:hypothetical protein [Lachnospiraceae bacterium]